MKQEKRHPEGHLFLLSKYSSSSPKTLREATFVMVDETPEDISLLNSLPCSSWLEFDLRPKEKHALTAHTCLAEETNSRIERI
jgi:hypothetical protein